MVGRNGWPPDVRSVHVAAIISYRCVQLVGTQRNPANLYLALVSHEYSGRNHSVLHELLHYYRDFPITNYAKFGCRITTKQPATTSMGSIIDIGKCLVCETSLLQKTNFKIVIFSKYFHKIQIFFPISLLFFKKCSSNSQNSLQKLKPIMIFHYMQTSYISTLQELIFNFFSEKEISELQLQIFE